MLLTSHPARVPANARQHAACATPHCQTAARGSGKALGRAGRTCHFCLAARQEPTAEGWQGLE